MVGTSFIKYWTNVGEIIALGGIFHLSNLFKIYDNLELGHIKPEFLPNEYTVEGTASERKEAIFSTAQNLWNITPEDWLKKEKDWLQDARKVSGSTKIDGKDRINDIVSAEILLRIIAAAKLVYEADCHEITAELLRSLNVTISEVCTKGRTRMIMVGDRSVYSILKKGGLMIGTGGGKYLPYPEKALPELLLMLHKESICPEAYLE